MGLDAWGLAKSQNRGRVRGRVGSRIETRLTERGRLRPLQEVAADVSPFSKFAVRGSQFAVRSSGRKSASGFVLVLLLELVLDRGA